jgi:hypothetical protein
MKLIIYRVFSFLILPMAVLFSISVMVFLRAAFANPAMLFPLFLIACIAIYTFASLNFLIKGIDGKKFLGRSSKEWLKVNAFISFIFGVLMIVQCTVILKNPDMLQNLATQARQNAGDELKISDADFINYLRITSYLFLAYAIVLIIHVFFTFQYIKLYNYLFKSEQE